MTQQEYENELKELKERLEKLEAAKIEEPQLKRWKPNTDEKYWVVRSYGQTDWFYWVDDETNNQHYITGNCFKSKEEAEEYKKQVEYTARYKNYIEEHTQPIDWGNNNQSKYFAYITLSHGIYIDYMYNWKIQGVIYASSEQIIEEAIKEIGEDNFKKYVLGVK